MQIRINGIMHVKLNKSTYKINEICFSRITYIIPLSIIGDRPKSNGGARSQGDHFSFGRGIGCLILTATACHSRI